MYELLRYLATAIVGRGTEGGPGFICNFFRQKLCVGDRGMSTLWFRWYPLDSITESQPAFVGPLNRQGICVAVTVVCTDDLQRQQGRRV